MIQWKDNGSPGINNMSVRKWDWFEKFYWNFLLFTHLTAYAKTVFATLARPAPTWNVGAIFTKPPSAAEPAKQAS
jgi:hypothetical protein